jgi:hypothetical protein
MTARASGSLKPVGGLCFSGRVPTRAQSCVFTSQVEEVGLLVELVEDGARTVLDVR